METQFGDEAMKNNLQPIFPLLPDGAVAVGDTWTREYVLSKPYPMITTYNCKLSSIEDGKARVEYTSVISADPDAEPLTMGPMTMAFALAGTQSGYSLIDQATGWPMKIENSQDIAGDITMSSPMMEAGEMTIPMTLKSTSVIESFRD